MATDTNSIDALICEICDDVPTTDVTTKKRLHDLQTYNGNKE